MESVRVFPVLYPIPNLVVESDCLATLEPDGSTLESKDSLSVVEFNESLYGEF